MCKNSELSTSSLIMFIKTLQLHGHLIKFQSMYHLSWQGLIQMENSPQPRRSPLPEIEMTPPSNVLPRLTPVITFQEQIPYFLDWNARVLLVSSELLAGVVFEGAFYSRARSIPFSLSVTKSFSKHGQFLCIITLC